MAHGEDLSSWGTLLKELILTLEQNSLVKERGTAEPEAITLLCVALERFKRREGGASESQPLPDATRSGLWWAAQELAPSEVTAQVRTWAQKRARGTLLQHLTGEQVFLDHVYEVSPEVLVPRPETEGLVVLALELLSQEFARGQSVGLGMELGLGSGVISIELLSARPELRMVASEASATAAAVADRNVRQILGFGLEDRGAIRRLELIWPQTPFERVQPFLKWSAAHGKKADFFISNPPYLSASTPGETDEEVSAQEPRLALFPDPSLADPLVFYRDFASELSGCLRPGGLVMVELAAERADETAQLFQRRSEEGPCWTEVILHPDLTGKPRFLSARLAN